MTGRLRDIARRSAMSGALVVAVLSAQGCDAALTGPGRLEPLSIAPFLRKPFAGDYPVTSFFDHDLPIRWGDANGYQLTFWGERAVGLDGHEGYDFAMPEGTPLLATAAGIVTRAGWSNDSYCPPLGRSTRNLRVVIRHDVAGGERFVTAYVHLREVLVEVGERVAAGQPIALSGNTGCSTGPHLHFQVEREARGEAPSAIGALGVPAERSVVVDPFGWDGSGGDPWSVTSVGSRSWGLWLEGAVPEFRRGGKRFLSLHPPEPVPVIIVDWVAMGVRDSEHLNNEMVELALNTSYASADSHDMTGYTIENNRGDSYQFPTGFRIFAARNVRLYSGVGQDSDTALYWGRNTEAWGNFGDCVTLRAPDRTLANRFQFYSSCSGLAGSSFSGRPGEAVP